ncbi:MAG: hypothetical protein ACYC3I_23615 [Gemmataceae bacterium]
MIVNLIVLAVTLLMLGFVAVWVFAPHLRGWLEAPKHRFLERERCFPSVTRGESRAERNSDRSSPRADAQGDENL